MALPHKIAVEVPPVDPASYRPFGADFDRTLDQILSEEASLESSRDEISFGGFGDPELLNQPGSPNDKATNKSPYFKMPPTMRETRATSRKNRVATRNITVVEIASDSEASVPEQKPKKPTPRKHRAAKRKASETKPSEPQETPDEPARVEEDVMDAAHGNVEDEPPRDGDLDLPPSTPQDIPEQGAENEVDAAEEDIIFALMEPTKRDEVLQFVVSHPFMMTPVQPVKRSDRRRFVDEICNKALSEGMGKKSVARFVRYVCRIYLDLANTQAMPSEGYHKDIPFGEEIDDEAKSKSPRGKHRRESSGDALPKKHKKRKTDKRRTSERSSAPEQPVPQLDHSFELRSTTRSPQVPAAVSTSRKGSLSKGSSQIRVDDAPEALPSLPLHSSPRGSNQPDVEMQNDGLGHEDMPSSDKAEFFDTQEFVKDDDGINDPKPLGNVAIEPSTASELGSGPLPPPSTPPKNSSRFTSTDSPSASKHRTIDTPPAESKKRRRNRLKRQKRRRNSKMRRESDTHTVQVEVETPKRARTSAPVSTPPSNRKSKYAPLSPDPAEWDVDFL